MSWIEEYKENEHIKEALLVTKVLKGVANNNAPYLTVSFQDKTGSIEGKKWDASIKDMEIFQENNVVEIEADVINYRNGLQLKIISGEKVDPANIDAARFTISAPVDINELERKLNTYICSIKDNDCRQIVEKIVANYFQDFLVYPAATRNHHEYSSGLLYHTLCMADLAEMIASYYPIVNRDLLISGVILHDIGKTKELSGPLIPKYTKEGRLIGHISIMQSEIRKVCEELRISSEVGLLLEHMILSHHGKQEFGSPVEPLTREAMLLNMIDDLDAKMTILDKAYLNVEEGEFTPKIFPLDDRCFYKPFTKK